MSKGNVILAAGGTGGHVFPAIATGEELKRRGYDVLFATDKRGEKYFKDKGLKYKIICSASPSGSPMKKILALYKLGWGMVQSGFLIGKYHPKFMIGFGGYPSFPPLLAAKIHMVKTVLHEQNSVLGKANRFLGKYASRIATSFPETKHASKAALVGNPVRGEITPTPFPPITDKLHILITGGSQGAKLFSDILPDVLAQFPNQIVVTHQVRDQEISAVNDIYTKAGVVHEVKSFFDDMPKCLAEAHLLICRAGASTIFELAAVGRPALFVPLANSAENHQLHNAEAVCQTGGGWLLQTSDFNFEQLSAKIAELINQPEKLKSAAENIRQFAKNNSAVKLADLAEELVK